MRTSRIAGVQVAAWISRFVAIVIVMVVLGVGPVVAQGTVATAKDMEGWASDIDKAAGLLAKGGERRTVKALDLGLELYDSMLGRLGRGDRSARLLGEVLLLLAVADARLGNEEIAIWRFVEAQSLLPGLGVNALADYQDVVSVLSPFLFAEGEREEWLRRSTLDVEGLRPPTPTAMAPIGYPGGARKQGIEGTTEVVVVIDETGLPVKPVLRASCGVPGFDVAVMEATRQWIFTPAYQDGVAVTGTYVLSARFHLGSAP